MSEETAEKEYHTTTFLDTAWMRLIALAVAIGGVLLFIYANEDFTAATLSGRSSGTPTPYQACLDERRAAVASLAREANYTAKQRELAEIRAEEYCRNEVGF